VAFLNFKTDKRHNIERYRILVLACVWWLHDYSFCW